MKKLFILTLVLVLALSLAACGDNSGGNSTVGNNSTPGGNNSTPVGNNTGEKLLAMTVTIPDGWKKTALDVDLVGGGSRYEPDTEPGKYPLTFFQMYIEENTFNRNEREFVQKQLENYKSMAMEESVFTPIADVTAGGHNALQFTSTDPGDNAIITSRTYIHKGKYVYVIQFNTTGDHWEQMSEAFDAMYESFTLK